MPLKLFPHQESVIPDLLRSLRPDNPTLLVSPTGSGKTVIAAEVALQFQTTLLVAHRTEIVEQARAVMGKNVQCMSIHQALHHGPPRVDLLIIDEAHRSTASTYRQIIEKYRGACVLGLTATPRRTDGQGLVDVFDEIVECSSVRDLVESGHLVPYRALEAPDEALSQLAHMKRQRGDYATGELSALMNRPRLVGDVVREYKKHGIGRKAVAFAVSVAHSKAMAAAFNADGVRAAHLDGKASRKTRHATLKDLAEGRLDVLCNVNLFTEGWDCPSVSCVIMARPTASLTLYLQSVGRGMRTSPGKADLLILDHAGNIERHGEPDERREWLLESEAQKAKREKEVAELERLHALGYESVEAELEAKRRIRDETYSPIQCAEILQEFWKTGGTGQVSTFLKRFGIAPIIKAQSHTRYRRADVECLLEVLRSSMTSGQCATLLGIQGFMVAPWMRVRGIQPIRKRGKYTLYPKAQVEAVAASITISDVLTIFGLRTKAQGYWLLKRHGIKSTNGRFAKDQIDSIAKKLT